MEVTVNVSDDAANLEQQIIKKAAEILIDSVGYQGRKDFEEFFIEARKQAVNEHIAPVIREVLEQPITPTNRVGEPRGPSQTLREYMADQVRNIITSNANDVYIYGLTGSRQLTDEEKRMPLIQVIVSRLMADIISQELKSAISNAAAATTISEEFKTQFVSALEETARKLSRKR